VTERNETRELLPVKRQGKKKAPPKPLPDHARCNPHHIHSFRRGTGKKERGSRAATTEIEKGRGAQAMTKEEKGTHLNGEQLSLQFKERNTLQPLRFVSLPVIFESQLCF